MSTNSESQGFQQAPISPQSWDTGEMQEIGAPPGDGGGGGWSGEGAELSHWWASLLACGVSLREIFP